MLYISNNKDELGSYYAPQSTKAPGLLEFPGKFLEVFNEYKGFVKLDVKEGKVVNIIPDKESYELWKENQPIIELPSEQEDVNTMLVDLAYKISLIELGVV